MTKNELMEMAREAGLLFNEEAGAEAAHAIHHERLQRFFNAILERAAVECEKVQNRLQTASGMVASEYCLDAIRALKITTGEGHE